MTNFNLNDGVNDQAPNAGRLIPYSQIDDWARKDYTALYADYIEEQRMAARVQDFWNANTPKEDR